jgi:hypothetical protein
MAQKKHGKLKIKESSSEEPAAIEEPATQEDLSNFTVKQLREMARLRSIDLKKAKKKKDIIKAIENG